MRGYESRRMAEALNSDIPVITADVEAATLYWLKWQHQSGSTIREVMVLALDEQMAEEMGGIRLRERHGENIMEWKLVDRSAATAASRASITACLTIEDPDETQLREEAFKSRSAA